MHIIFFDDHNWDNLLPLTYTRPAAELRIGIQTISEKWRAVLGHHAPELSSAYFSRPHLQEKYGFVSSQDAWLIAGYVCPNDKLVAELLELKTNQGLYHGDQLLALRCKATEMASTWDEFLSSLTIDKKQSSSGATEVHYPWDIFTHNGVELELDFDRLTAGRRSAPLSGTNQVLGDRVFVEEGATVECSILNSLTGPIYIGKDAEVMEGSVIRGGFALLDHSATKLGTKVYGPTTVGPHSKIGGEVNNSVIIGYSNKGHDGFLGNAVLGEWCNLGADTNNSNLKNNYAECDAWNYPQSAYIKTGLQFCGLIMGDHSKSGINTMFNTSTVVGVSANIYGSDFPKKHIPSFMWGSANRMVPFRVGKAFEVAERMMARRNIEFDDVERRLLEGVFELTESQRK